MSIKIHIEKLSICISKYQVNNSFLWALIIFDICCPNDCWEPLDPRGVNSGDMFAPGIDKL